MASFTLSPKGTTDPVSGQALDEYSAWVDWTCLITSQTAATCSYSAGGRGAANEDGIITYQGATFSATVADPVNQGSFQQDASCASAVGINIIVKEDRGAVVGTAATIANRVGGYNHYHAGNSILFLNGGKPF